MATDYASSLFAEPATGEDKKLEQPQKDYASTLFADAPAESPETPQVKTGQLGLPTLDSLDAFIENDPSPLAEHFRKQSEGQLMKFGAGMTRKFQGVNQATLSTLEHFNLVDPGTTKAYTDATEAEKKLMDQQIKSEYGDKSIFTIADIAGQAAPDTILPAGGQTMTARAILGALSGAAAGFTQFVEDGGNTRGENTALGGTAGAVLSPLLEVIPTTRNMFRRYLGISTGKTSFKNVGDLANYESKQKFIDRGFFISDKTGVQFKLSQITGDQATEAMEQLARQGRTGEALARKKETEQVSQIFKYWNRTLPKLSNNRVDFGSQVKTAFDDVVGDPNTGKGLLGARKSAAKRNFAAVDDAIGSTGTIPINNFKNSIDDLIAANSQRGATPRQAALVKNLQSIVKDFEDNPSANVAELQNLLTTYGDASQGSGRIFTDEVDKVKDSAVARKLFGSLRADLDEAIKSGMPGANDLKIARDSYNEYTKSLNEIRDSALGKLFNKKVKPTGEDISDAFIKMKPAQVESALKILGTSNPEIAQSAKRFYLKSYLDKSKVQGQADSYGFVPAKMLDLIKDRERFKAMFPDKETRLMVMNGIEATRRIMLNNFRTGGRTLPRAKELAGVIASRDRTFVARLAADIFSPEIVSRSLLTEEGVRGLQALATPYNQNVWTAGLVDISNAIKDSMSEEQ